VAKPKARVLIVCDRSLFGEGLEGLLRGEEGLEVVGWVSDPAEAVKRVKKAPPDAVILTGAEAAMGLEAELLWLAREGLTIRIVEIDLATNTLCVYCGEQYAIREARGLANAVEQVCGCLTPQPLGRSSPVAHQPAV